MLVSVCLFVSSFISMFVYLCYLQYIYSYKLTTYLIRVAGTGAAVCVLGGGDLGNLPPQLGSCGGAAP